MIEFLKSLWGQVTLKTIFQFNMFGVCCSILIYFLKLLNVVNNIDIFITFIPIISTLLITAIVFIIAFIMFFIKFKK